jgi:hypothetical protein
MTATTTTSEQSANAQREVELSSQVPRTALMGDQFSCEWRLTNNSDTAVPASF